MSSRVEERDQALSSRKAALEQEYQQIEKQADILADVRVAAFLGMMAFVVSMLVKKNGLFLIPAGIFLILFVVFVVLHSRKKNEAKKISTLMEIHACYLARTKHDFTQLTDDGEDLAVKAHPFAGDLDLFGPKSLFALINVAHTAYGRKQLQKWLLCASEEDISLEEIQARQDAVKELADEYEKVEELEVSTKMNVKKKGSPAALLSFIKIGFPECGKAFCVARIVVTLGIWSTLILALTLNKMIFVGSAVFFVIQLAMMMSAYKNNQTSFGVVEKFYPELRAYANIFTELESVEVKSAYLKSLQKRLYGEKSEETSGQSASNQLFTLYKISLMVQVRMQPLLYFLLNLVFLYDEWCLRKLNAWRKEAGTEIPDKLQAIGEWEALMSLSVVSMIYPDGCVPEMVDSDKPFFRGEQIGHPLIPTDKLVCNDFSLDHGCAMITGSNMSGKTTLLRTVGINTVLAYAGATCPASKLCLSVMRLAASMRIEDDLGEGVSTFYAELLKIERIVKASESGKPLLFLIDEIFRGTNSKDRTDGAWIVLKKLHCSKIIGMMSTHDYELCKMSDRDEVDLVFYHFSEYFDDEGMHFDYKLKDGMSTETNAKYLMKMVGIDE